MDNPPKPRKKRRSWLERKLGWVMALMGADPGFKPWEEEPYDDSDKPNDADKSPPSPGGQP